jgi:glycolate oxidase iron-sulfur subunit
MASAKVAAPMNSIDVPAKGPAANIVDYDLLFDCVHCGLCLESCPTYVITRRETDSPRGRIYLMKALAEGRIELDESAVRHLDLCLGCRGCETACPSGVHYGRLIERARDYVARNYRRSSGERIRRRLIGGLFTSYLWIRIAAAPVRAARALGLEGLLRALAPRSLRRMLDLFPKGRPVSSAPWSDRKPEVGRPVAMVHPGCVARALAGSETINTENALRAAGYPVSESRPMKCCGALDLHSGNRARAIELARANTRAFRKSGAEVILSAASGCSAAMASYGDLLRDDPEYGADGAILAAKVRDLSTMLADTGEPVARRLDCIVTYHDSCHLAHGLKVREAPRRLLMSIPGVKLVEMAESDLCCGSAGTYNLTEPKMADELVRRKVDNIVATGANYVVLANPGCEFQISSEIRRRGIKTRAINIADFLALANR